jgi:hypothetical protein
MATSFVFGGVIFVSSKLPLIRAAKKKKWK